LVAYASLASASALAAASFFLRSSFCFGVSFALASAFAAFSAAFFLASSSAFFFSSSNFFILASFSAATFSYSFLSFSSAAYSSALILAAFNASSFFSLPLKEQLFLSWTYFLVYLTVLQSSLPWHLPLPFSSFLQLLSFLPQVSQEVPFSFFLLLQPPFTSLLQLPRVLSFSFIQLFLIIFVFLPLQQLSFLRLP